MNFRRSRPATGSPVLGFVEPDVALILDYLGGELSTAREEVVEARLIEDAAFFELALPFMAMHDTEHDLGDMQDLVAEVVPDAPLMQTGEPAAPQPAAPAGSRRWFTMKTASIVMAAFTIVAALLPFDPVIKQYLIESHDTSAGGALATAGEVRHVRLAGGQRITLQPHSFLGFDDGGQRRGAVSHLVGLKAPARTDRVWLQGSAGFDVPAGDRELEVVTPTGTVVLEADGSYDVTSGNPPQAPGVTVHKGKAHTVQTQTSTDPTPHISNSGAPE
jgi:ferric-dicitrate binding protein FerR (iron transport regulator)